MFETREEQQLSEYSLVKMCSDDQLRIRDRIIRRDRALMMAGLAIIALLVYQNTRLGSAVKTVPIPIFFDQQYNARAGSAGKEVKLDKAMWQGIKHIAFTSFITNWRGVTTDLTYRKVMWDDVFLNIGKSSSADAYINRWYRENEPDDRGAKETVTIDIESDGEISDNAYEVWWKETSIPIGGTVATAQRWRGVFTYAINPPKEVTTNMRNPLGLFITEFRSVVPVGPKEQK